MDKKKLHIDEVGNNSYPEPDIPVQQAWDNMQQLLLQTPAVSTQPSGFKKWLGKGIGKFFIGASVVATVSMITLVVIKNKEQKSITPVTYKSDSIINTQPVVASDTLPPVVKEKTGSFNYEAASLKEVALDMEKAFDIKVILKDNYGDLKLTTRLDRVTLKEMLKIITVVLGGKYKIDEANRQVTIFKNGAKE